MAGDSVSIRREEPADAAAIFSVIARAFDAHPHSNGCEPYIVQALRDAGVLTLSLVAVIEGEIRGHVAFSPVRVNDGTTNWYGLGPVAVDPRVQRNGLGSALITTGLQQLRESGASGCVVLGEPAYYSRFGFRNAEDLRYPGPPPEYFMALAFEEALPRGEVSYHPAFESAPPKTV